MKEKEVKKKGKRMKKWRNERGMTKEKLANMLFCKKKKLKGRDGSISSDNGSIFNKWRNEYWKGTNQYDVMRGG